MHSNTFFALPCFVALFILLSLSPSETFFSSGTYCVKIWFFISIFILIFIVLAVLWIFADFTISSIAWPFFHLWSLAYILFHRAKVFHHKNCYENNILIFDAFILVSQKKKTNCFFWEFNWFPIFNLTIKFSKWNEETKKTNQTMCNGKICTSI